MQPSLFKRRLLWIREHRFTVVPLKEAVDSLYDGTLPSHPVAITFDDGWFGTYRHALPILTDLNFPATIYITTYYAEKATQVFDVAVSYMFWRTKAESIDVSRLDCRLEGVYSLNDPIQKHTAVQKLIEFGDSFLDSKEKQEFARDLGYLLNVNFHEIERKRMYRLMTLNEIKDAADSGFDIQLHTHRHRLSFRDWAVLEREINNNRQSLAPVVHRDLVHFCYPSGEYHPCFWPWLEQLGIQTATTTKAGFNYPSTHRFELGRFLDGENIAAIEFEAELCGFLEIMRNIRSAFSRFSRSRNDMAETSPQPSRLGRDNEQRSSS